MSKPYLAASILLAVTSLFLVALAASGTTIETADKVWVECDANAETILDVEILRNGKPFDKLEFSLKRVAGPRRITYRNWWTDEEISSVELVFPCRHSSIACGGGGGQYTTYSVQDALDQRVMMIYSSSSVNYEDGRETEFSREFLFPVGKKTELQLSDGFVVRANFRAHQ